MAGKSKAKPKSTGIIATPVLMDMLSVTIDNLVNAGYVVLTGNQRAGFTVHVEGVYRCGFCGKLVPTQFVTNTGCVNCQPAAFDVASTGNKEEPTP